MSIIQRARKSVHHLQTIYPQTLNTETGTCTFTDGPYKGKTIQEAVAAEIIFITHVDEYKGRN